LGIEVKNTLILHIKIPLHSTVDLYIDKECSKETLIDRIQEVIIEEEEEYGLFKFFGICLFFTVVIYGGITCYNMKKGLPFIQAVPCGSDCITKVCGSCVVKISTF
jgi:hypothetical protein